MSELAREAADDRSCVCSGNGNGDEEEEEEAVEVEVGLGAEVKIAEEDGLATFDQLSLKLTKIQG